MNFQILFLEKLVNLVDDANHEHQDLHPPERRTLALIGGD